MKERGILTEFEWLNVSEVKKSRIVNEVEKNLEVLKNFGLQIPNLVVVVNESIWDKNVSPDLGGAADRKRKKIFLPENFSLQFIVHEVVHLNFPQSSEDDIVCLTSQYLTKIYEL